MDVRKRMLSFLVSIYDSFCEQCEHALLSRYIFLFPVMKEQNGEGSWERKGKRGGGRVGGGESNVMGMMRATGDRLQPRFLKAYFVVE